MSATEVITMNKLFYIFLFFATANHRCIAQQRSRDPTVDYINSQIQAAFGPDFEIIPSRKVSSTFAALKQSISSTPWDGPSNTRFTDNFYRGNGKSNPCRVSDKPDHFDKETDTGDSRILPQRPSSGKSKTASQYTDNERWSWGLVEDSTNNRPQATTQKHRTQQQSNSRNTVTRGSDDYKKYAQYCKELDPTVPDFRAPGKRLAQVKCEEEIWRKRFDNEKFKRYLKCSYYNITKAEREGEELPSYGRGAIGGRAALDGEFPHMAAIGYKADNGSWTFLCGGSLISPRYVLTAAHCMYAPNLIDPTPKIVRLGDTYLKRPASKNSDFGLWDQFNIKRRIVHPQYKSPVKYFDIALLELESNVTYNKYVQPACLWHDNNLRPLGTQATLTGWGVIETETKRLATVLQAADVDIIDTPTCNYYLKSRCNKKWCGVRDHQVCAGKLEGGVDACQGDSGGPLQVKINLGLTPEDDEVVLKKLVGYATIIEVNMHYVFGITSFGIGCAQKNLPGVYTRVSSFLDWIESIVWK